MNLPFPGTESPSAALLALAPAAIAARGYIVVDSALPDGLAEALWQESRTEEERRYRPAGIGRQDWYRGDTEVRADDIQWFDGTTFAGKAYLELMEALRLELNRQLFLGLFDYECHFARYLEGAYYKTHLDAFSGGRNRVLSTVLYLNRDWGAEEGGELLLYDSDGQTVVCKVTPEHNRLVLFLSESFPHEVLPTRRVRYSLTGWFRLR